MVLPNLLLKSPSPVCVGTASRSKPGVTPMTTGLSLPGSCPPRQNEEAPLPVQLHSNASSPAGAPTNLPKRALTPPRIAHLRALLGPSMACRCSPRNLGRPAGRLPCPGHPAPACDWQSMILSVAHWCRSSRDSVSGFNRETGSFQPHLRTAKPAGQSPKWWIGCAMKLSNNRPV